ncbi:efflux RND transporter periplasmic adaptor subunit [Pseudoalteromonas denitrificans]|uniref:RND family efflux transporter, MFP subunit n=1 Tax=Pseudoalteromonas denitrificans DSM 6059 TaxID=1123010 RepID=A0A1I1EZV2_9GAMM|nr:efflux RND transporter periplasmic adaptor subunit [Pseudoalteromonas denitrificans]SFB92541.1 RND family efflux transporter, MFP subunit [Pseudoalteromonas denitrificans DSM 6059]
MFTRILMKGLFAGSIVLLSQTSFAADIPASPIKVDTVTKVALSATTDLMGTLHSRSHIQVTAGINGRLEWLAEPGTYANKGDILVKMDLLPLELKLAEQKAQIKRAEINTAYFKNEWDRLQKLRKTNSTSQYQLDQTRSQYELAQADIEIAHLKLQQIEDQINRATVKAPFEGVITQRMTRAGTDVSRSDVLLKLLDTKHLEVRVFVPIKYLAYIHTGNPLKVVANDKKIKAQIIAKIPSADPRSQTFEVRLQVPQVLNDYWAAGQLVKVTVPVQDNQAKLTVHRDALILRKEGTYVIKVDADNKAHKLLVKVGQGTFERVSIEGDLLDGDKVAIRGAERLTEGQLVVVN